MYVRVRELLWIMYMYIYIYIYIYIYAFMCVCMHVCMYVLGNPLHNITTSRNHSTKA